MVTQGRKVPGFRPYSNVQFMTTTSESSILAYRRDFGSQYLEQTEIIKQYLLTLPSG